MVLLVLLRLSASSSLYVMERKDAISKTHSILVSSVRSKCIHQPTYNTHNNLKNATSSKNIQQIMPHKYKYLPWALTEDENGKDSIISRLIHNAQLHCSKSSKRCDRTWQECNKHVTRMLPKCRCLPMSQKTRMRNSINKLSSDDSRRTREEQHLMVNPSTSVSPH